MRAHGRSNPYAPPPSALRAAAAGDAQPAAGQSNRRAGTPPRGTDGTKAEHEREQQRISNDGQPQALSRMLSQASLKSNQAQSRPLPPPPSPGKHRAFRLAAFDPNDGVCDGYICPTFANLGHGPTRELQPGLAATAAPKTSSLFDHSSAAGPRARVRLLQDLSGFNAHTNELYQALRGNQVRG